MEPLELTDQTFDKFRKLVFDRTGISLSPSKRQLLKSRLQRRIRTLDLASFEAYFSLLNSLSATDPETVEFVNAITTNKTDFFREPHHFEFAIRRAIPECIEAGQRKVRVWHAGCSTGEEGYTLGMAVQESGLDRRIELSQLATDIDTQVLQTAENGVYSEERVRTIERERLRRFFLRGKGSMEGLYKIHSSLQSTITYRPLNLVQFPWPLKATTQFDIIFCRNVLIYFNKETQQKIIQGFHARIRPGGYLFLGHSESVMGMQDELISLGKTMYRVEHPGSALRKIAA